MSNLLGTKKLLFTVVVMFCVSTVFGVEDQKAKSILEEVTKATKAYKSINALFDYVMENKEEDIYEVNTGEIFMERQKYMLTLSPLGLEVYCDGKDVWTFMKDANEVTIADIEDESSKMMNPSKMFTIYEDGFSYKFIKEATSEGHPVYVIDLFPEDQSLEYSQIQIDVDKQLKLIRKAELTGRDGNNYVIRMNNIKTDVPVNNEMFIFHTSKHPGVEIIDLR